MGCLCLTIAAQQRVAGLRAWGGASVCARNQQHRYPLLEEQTLGSGPLCTSLWVAMAGGGGRFGLAAVVASHLPPLSAPSPASSRRGYVQSVDIVAPEAAASPPPPQQRLQFDAAHPPDDGGRRDASSLRVSMGDHLSQAGALDAGGPMVRQPASVALVPPPGVGVGGGSSVVLWPQPHGSGVMVGVCLGAEEVLAMAAAVLDGLGQPTLAGQVRGALREDDGGSGGGGPAKRRRVGDG